MVQLRTAHRLAAVVVVLGLLGGIALIVSGAEYGLSSRSGVGPGTFPAAAGVLLALASLIWGAGLLRRPTPAAAPLLKAGLGVELTHRIGDVERQAHGRIELDESVTATAVDVIDPDDQDDPPAPDLTPAQARSGNRRVLLVLAAVAVAATLLDTLGFVMVMTLQLTAILIAAGRQRWWKALLVALAIALVTRFVFGELLGVVLPASGLPLLSTWGI